MDEQNRVQTPSASSRQTGQCPHVPYQRNVPHITQEPIMDGDEPAYHAPNTGSRRHMGVASSDAEYLKQAGRPARPAHPRSSVPGEGEPQKLHYDRYLSTPSSHKTIFIARQERARRRTRILLVMLLVIVVAVVVWLLFFR